MKKLAAPLRALWDIIDAQQLKIPWSNRGKLPLPKRALAVLAAIIVMGVFVHARGAAVWAIVDKFIPSVSVSMPNPLAAALATPTPTPTTTPSATPTPVLNVPVGMKEPRIICTKPSYIDSDFRAVTSPSGRRWWLLVRPDGSQRWFPSAELTFNAENEYNGRVYIGNAPQYRVAAFLLTEEGSNEVIEYLDARDIDGKWELGMRLPEASIMRDYKDVVNTCITPNDPSKTAIPSSSSPPPAHK